MFFVLVDQVAAVGFNYAFDISAWAMSGRLAARGRALIRSALLFTAGLLACVLVSVDQAEWSARGRRLVTRCFPWLVGVVIPGDQEKLATGLLR